MELLHALTGWPVIVAVRGLLVAWWFYIKSPETPKRLAAKPARALHADLCTNITSTKSTTPLFVAPLLWISRMCCGT